MKKYYIPFSWIDRPSGESNIGQTFEEIYVGIMTIGVIVSSLFFLIWFLVWEELNGLGARILIISMLMWIIPNYHIAYNYYLHDKEKIDEK